MGMVSWYSISERESMLNNVGRDHAYLFLVCMVFA